MRCYGRIVSRTMEDRMRSTTLSTRALIATGALFFAAVSSAQQAPHSVTCVDGTTDLSNAKAPCNGHGGIKPARGAVAVNAAPAAGAVAVNTPGSASSTTAPAHTKPKPKPAPPPAPGSSAALNGDTKIESSPRDPAAPQKISTAASGGIGNTEVKKVAPASVGSGGIGNTAVHKEGQLGGTGNTAVEKEGQMNKTAGGVGNTAVMKEGQNGPRLRRHRSDHGEQGLQEHRPLQGRHLLHDEGRHDAVLEPRRRLEDLLHRRHASLTASASAAASSPMPRRSRPSPRALSPTRSARRTRTPTSPRISKSTTGCRSRRASSPTPLQLILLAEHDGALAGYAHLRTGAPPPCVTGEAPVEIARFYVDRRHHGSGLAQQLMTAARSAASDMGARTLWLGVWEHNPRAIAYYAKSGLRDVGSADFFVGPDRQTDRIMVLDLTTP